MDSSIEQAQTKLSGGPLEMVYIRAPKITRIGRNVEVLAERDGDPVLVRSGKVLVATFHPELAVGEDRVHREFLDSVRAAKE